MTEEYPKPLYHFVDRQVVALSQDFTRDGMKETRADLTPDGAQLVRFRQDGDGKQLKLSAQELDALCGAWLAYRGERWLEEEAFKAQAYALVADYPEIQIVLSLTGGWHVRIPSIDFGFYQPARDAEELLMQVHSAKDVLLNQQPAVI
jgi:hypothetical protein